MAVHMHPDMGASASPSATGSYLKYAIRNGGLFLTVCAIIYIFKVMRDSGDQNIAPYVRERLSVPARSYVRFIASLIFGLLSFGVFMYAYSTIKTRIPEFAPFRWDEAFMLGDRALFLGHDPWTLFAWIYEAPALLYAMDFIYDVWAVILVGTWTLCFIYRGHSAQTRFRFPLALLLTWFIGGNILAIVLSSAGPCYYGAVTGLDDPYAAQLVSLSALSEASPLRAVTYQELLWSVYESPSLGFGGISAMPSMHCATSFLLVLLAWRRKALRYAAISFFMFILISSFVLAWHYALDGIVAIPIALACWWLAGKILTRLLPPQRTA